MSIVEFNGMRVRRPEPDDHPRVLKVLDRWWGEFEGSTGSVQRALLLPRLYFQHFTTGSFLVERDGELTGFLVGFLSQTRPDESYIHFVGVAPEEQGRGLGTFLYERFFAYGRAHGRSVVRAITSSANTGSFAFHTRMGFTAEAGPKEVEGRPVQPDYDGPGLDRVSFVRPL
ncbi:MULTISPECIES: GNAT family N-acetyltransferase [unclassified Streptomyces]|uniref:GNAT family N-acetyltransferase n=1 Tax=unclassified Streptomyces TaxID=2593676 RepID=UPI0018F2D95E|nr:MULTISPECIES: GNAT family N-acetyltransferase [unclassified Streptomyces]